MALITTKIFASECGGIRDLCFRVHVVALTERAYRNTHEISELPSARRAELTSSMPRKGHIEFIRQGLRHARDVKNAKQRAT